MTNKDLLDKVRGSLVGGAVGDALGYPIEFIYSFDEIRAKYGEAGVLDYDINYPWLTDGLRHSMALFSDDTQMTLYTAEGLLYAVRNDKPIVPMVCNAYLYWLAGQMDTNYAGDYPSELAGIEELNQPRAPGNTCISALMSIQAGKDPANNSKGCGGIMRIAPVALYGAAHGWPVEKTARIAGEVAELTHLHPMSTFASACAAAIIQLCVTDEESKTPEGFSRIVQTSLDCIEDLYPEHSAMSDFKALITKALSLKDNQLADWENIENSLGGGWIAEETLAIVVFSTARHLDSFGDCVVSAVNHGGDSDSTGAVAGNIIGAILGYNAIPEKFTQTIQLKSLLIQTADFLIQ